MAMLEAMLEGVPVLSNIPVHQQLTAGELGSPRSETGTRGMLFRWIWTLYPAWIGQSITLRSCSDG